MMALRSARRFRHFPMKYRISPLKKVLRKIANPLPIGRLIHEYQGNANAPRI